MTNKLLIVVISAFFLLQTAQAATISGPPGFSKFSTAGIKRTATKPADILSFPVPQACVDVFDGTQGPRGFRGYSGSSGGITIGTTTTGAAGTSATVTNTGTFSSAILNFTIPKGADGDINNITQAQIEAKIATQGGKLFKRALNADSEVLVEIARVAGGTSIFLTGAGLIVVQDNNGVRRWGFDPSSWSMSMKKGNGATVFSINSTGRVKIGG